ncbi:MAG: alpha/beta hydrolase [Nitrosopumilus sp.]|nr:alpha/beta hydrolase [Nitrosopumilus sp.]
MKIISLFPTSFLLVIALSLICGLIALIINPNLNLVYATNSLSQSIQHNQQDLQSTINDEVKQTITNTIQSINNNNTNNGITLINNTEPKKVTVGDIEVTYKILGKGEPILLISGSGNVMDVWPSYLLQELSKDHQVIIFDNRGVGNTTSGIKLFSIEQFANDTAGLMDALEIQKADVIGFSMASFIAQQLTLTHPEKVNRLILYGASCGGQESIPQNANVVNALSDFVNNRTVDVNAFQSVTFPPEWIKENPKYLDTIPKTSEMVPSTTLKKQFEINEEWLSKNWNGVCNQLTKITQPTLIITGTADVAIPAANSLILVDKIPGAWLVQIKEAGHGLMYQFPEKFTTIVETFLNESEN